MPSLQIAQSVRSMREGPYCWMVTEESEGPVIDGDTDDESGCGVAGISLAPACGSVCGSGAPGTATGRLASAAS